jgi:hypothetical protein
MWCERQHSRGYFFCAKVIGHLSRNIPWARTSSLDHIIRLFGQRHDGLAYATQRPDTYNFNPRDLQCANSLSF